MDTINRTKKYVLTGQEKTVIEVDVREVDTAITDFLRSKNYSDKNLYFHKYGYECIAENEWSNYQSHAFTVTPETPEDPADIEGLSTGEILNWMCAEGLIKQGEYLVDVFW